jgi:hypothetical protein
MAAARLSDVFRRKSSVVAQTGSNFLDARVLFFRQLHFFFVVVAVVDLGALTLVDHAIFALIGVVIVASAELAQ